MEIKPDRPVGDVADDELKGVHDLLDHFKEDEETRAFDDEHERRTIREMIEGR